MWQLRSTRVFFAIRMLRAGAGLAASLALDANGNLVTDFSGLGVWIDTNKPAGRS
jgi:hypothetical protein